MRTHDECTKCNTNLKNEQESFFESERLLIFADWSHIFFLHKICES